MYRQICLNCFRYLDFKSCDEVDKLSIFEYNLLIKAAELKEVDLEYHIHLLAFNNYRMKAQKKAGKNKSKPVYDKFKKFYDYEDRVNEILGNKKSKFDKLKNFLKERRDRDA